MSLHPPEVVLGRPITQAVDIWNLGCTVRGSTNPPMLALNLLFVKTYELVIGRAPFDAGFSDKELLPQFKKMIGGVPDKWIQDAFGDSQSVEGIIGQTSPII